ncbi:MAG: YicC/YloC family endoribonuclease [Thermoanaerobaculales bacterium]
MTVSSMTGFGRAQGRLSDRFAASVVVRSVNHRYLDVQVRTNLREEAPELEAVLRAAVARHLRRGRVTTQLNLERSGAASVDVAVNAEAVGDVLEQLAGLALPDNVSGSVELRDVLVVPGLISVRTPENLLDEIESVALDSVVTEAVEAALTMRCEEGTRLGRQIESELGEVVAFIDWFEPQMSDFRRRILERTRERVAALLEGQVAMEPERVVQEAALMADRSDVSEEIVRLRAHLETFGQRLADGGTVGRTLDFICQEIHRELNTLGSKCRELGVTNRLVEAKAAAERIREQVQNLE